MASFLVGQHQITTFSTPVNGTTPIDANQVRGNDNTIKTAYDAHDLDGTIHLQSSTLAARPAAGTEGLKWLTNDGLRIYYDTGSVWSEIAYLPTAGGTVSGDITLGASNELKWTGRSTIGSPADGSIQFLNAAATGFTTLYLGGTSSSFPALKVSGAGLLVRLGDDTGNTTLTASRVIGDADVSTAIAKGVFSDGTYSTHDVAVTSALGALTSFTNSGTSGTFIAGKAQLQTNIAGTTSNYGLHGTSIAEHTTGTINQIKGIAGIGWAAGNGGTTTNLVGLNSGIVTRTGATATNAFGVMCSAADSTGTITNLYGVYVESMTAGATLNYAYFQAGKNDSVFNGSGSSLANAATVGFLHAPNTAGTPSGTPANLVTGATPMIVDITAGKLWLYYSAAWHFVTFT